MVQTFGPWEACGNLIRTQREADGSGGFLVAEIPANTGDTSEKARIMAAAPELLEALRDVIGWVPGRAAFHTDAAAKAVERAVSAITKATGSQQ